MPRARSREDPGPGKGHAVRVGSAPAGGPLRGAGPPAAPGRRAPGPANPCGASVMVGDRLRVRVKPPAHGYAEARGPVGRIPAARESPRPRGYEGAHAPRPAARARWGRNFKK